MTVILAIANHNSGAGKTVTAANVAAGSPAPAAAPWPSTATPRRT
jgi:hypothetical protein